MYCLDRGVGIGNHTLWYENRRRPVDQRDCGSTH
jgi:hypothetical protein